VRLLYATTNDHRIPGHCQDYWLFPLIATTALAYIPMRERRGFMPASGKDTPVLRLLDHEARLDPLGYYL
jgi:hypothetical protein